MSRRSFLRKMLWGAGGLAALTAGGGTYSFFGERFWTQTNRLTLSFPSLPAAFSGMRLVQISDLHLGKFFSVANLEKVVDRVMALSPDMICFTGDLFDAVHGEPSDDYVPALSRLRAELGQWAVLGNHDLRLKTYRIVPILEKAGFRVLKNDNRPVVRDGDRIYVAGVDELLYGKPDVVRATAGTEPHFTLLLAHEPDYADRVAASGANAGLMLSGHSHGGQIRLPLIGPLITPSGGEKYVSGLYRIGDAGMPLYTNRGIGTSVLPIRFLCRPEITVFTLLRGEA